MYTDELMRHGLEGSSNFIGVFPLDNLPLHLPRHRGSFIVNTDTLNLDGQHWLAVSYNNGGIVKAFDPLGIFYPSNLGNYLARHLPQRRITFNREMYQNPLKKTCGEHCLQWLKFQEYKHTRYVVCVCIKS